MIKVPVIRESADTITEDACGENVKTNLWSQSDDTPSNTSA